MIILLIVTNSLSLFYAISLVININNFLNFSIRASFYVLLINNNILYLFSKLIKAFIKYSINTFIIKFSALYI